MIENIKQSQPVEENIKSDEIATAENAEEQNDEEINEDEEIKEDEEVNEDEEREEEQEDVVDEDNDDDNKQETTEDTGDKIPHKKGFSTLKRFKGCISSRSTPIKTSEP